MVPRLPVTRVCVGGGARCSWPAQLHQGRSQGGRAERVSNIISVTRRLALRVHGLHRAIAKHTSFEMGP